MKSIADQSRVDTLHATSQTTASERIELALRLGDQAIDIFASANNVGKDEARRVLRRNNQLGRRHSAVALVEDQ